MKRPSSIRSPLAAVVLSLAAALAACGGGTAEPPAAAPSTGSSKAGEGTPAAKCLAIADAPREHKADEPSKIGAKHILVKYAGAKGASSSVTRTREQACLRALEARQKMEQGMSFADAVAAYSEEPGAATREGLVGTIERKDVVPPFADAAFELGRGEVSHVVETDYGFHIILRSE